MLQDFTVRNITKYESGFALAGVVFQLGPVIIRGAKIFEKNGQRWLGMPGRISDNGDWGDFVYFLDQDLKSLVERAVIEKYSQAYEKSGRTGATK
ncbi:MAG: septation protein SpoVG family protein [Candidatus Bruticola sp.]